MESCLKAAFQYEDDDKKLKLVKKLAIPAKIVLSLIYRRNLKKLGKNPAICMSF